MHRQSTLIMFLACLGLLPLGCAGKANPRGLKLVPVQGRVLWNGQPLEEAAVTFSNAAANIGAYGTSGADGRFTLTTFEHGDGAVPGSHEVSVRKVRIIDRTPQGFVPVRGVMLPPPEEVWLIPKRYGAFTTSHLTAQVAEDGKNNIVLELSGSVEGPAEKK